MRICICIKTGEEEKGVRNNVFRVACVVVCAFLAQKAFFFFFLLLFVLAGAGDKRSPSLGPSLFLSLALESLETTHHAHTRSIENQSARFK